MTMQTPLQGQAGGLPDIRVLAEKANCAFKAVGDYVEFVNNGPATRNLESSQRWNAERMDKLNWLQRQYDQIAALIDVHPEKRKLKVTKGRRVGKRRGAQ